MQKDHLEIILADMNSKFDLLLEGHAGLRDEIRETRTELTNKKIMHEVTWEKYGK
ncbi:MAG: hypothetical protein K0A93_06600 [Desulfuromonadaceae bacterium]|nr:hypothetical protein [Desulfuromonadaceae bacterium]